MSLFHHSTKPVTSIFTTTEGHLSIAQAVQQALDQDHTTHLNLIHAKEFSFYVPFYLFFPHLFKIPFKLTKFSTIQKIVHSYSRITYQKNISQYLKSQKPQVVVSCYYLHNHLLQQYQVTNKFPFFNTIANPRTFSTLELSPQAYNLVFDSNAFKTCLSHGIPPEKIIVSGWFVRNQFEKKYNQKKVRQQLKLKPDILTLLVVAGSEGTNTVLKNFPAFINSKKPIQVIFACGRNKTLYSTINTLSKAVKITNPKNKAKIIPLTFTKNIHLYLQAADLVIGKAGPNLLFESVATHTPFLATTHVSGQEDGNLDIIKEYKLGYVEENLVRSVKLIKHIINQPEILKQFQPSLKKVATHNHNSKKILLQTIQTHLKTTS